MLYCYCMHKIKDTLNLFCLQHCSFLGRGLMELETYTGSTMYTQKWIKTCFAILTWNTPFSKQNKYVSDKALAPHSTSLTSIKRDSDDCIPNGPDYGHYSFFPFSTSCWQANKQQHVVIVMDFVQFILPLHIHGVPLEMSSDRSLQVVDVSISRMPVGKGGDGYSWNPTPSLTLDIQ